MHPPYSVKAKLLVQFQKTADGFVVFCSELKIYAFGKTIAQGKKEFAKALKDWILDLAHENALESTIVALGFRLDKLQTPAGFEFTVNYGQHKPAIDFSTTQTAQVINMCEELVQA
jgi:hypothetical protein